LELPKKFLCVGLATALQPSRQNGQDDDEHSTYNFICYHIEFWT